MRSQIWSAALVIALGCQGDRQGEAEAPAPAPEAAASEGEGGADGSAGEASTHAGAEAGILAEIDLVALRDAGAFEGIPSGEVEVLEDPAYHAPKRYRGWPLPAVLNVALAGLSLGPGQEVQLVAVDGYTATVPAEQLKGAAGTLAFADLDAPKGSDWLPFQQGKRTLTPAPFYMVWHKTAYGPAHPWPYQLARMRVIDVAVAYGAAFPAHAPEARAGFELFKARCSACHTINLVGGTLGPELNVPKSVTEYWPEAHLRGYIGDPGSYRARAVMPDVGLTPGEVEAVVDYLKVMAEAKICGTKESCERDVKAP